MQSRGKECDLARQPFGIGSKIQGFFWLNVSETSRCGESIWNFHAMNSRRRYSHKESGRTARLMPMALTVLLPQDNAAPNGVNWSKRSQMASAFQYSETAEQIMLLVGL